MTNTTQYPERLDCPTAAPALADAAHAPAVWRVLIVEDVPSQKKLLATVLKKAGHDVMAVDGGQEAVDLVARQPFDLVLMDVQMPGMNGLDATRAIRAREAQTGGHVPIVAVTAHALNGDDERCRSAGADAYMRKPINLVEMMALLKQIAARSIRRKVEE